jgi:pilus assembly protein CpaE
MDAIIICIICDDPSLSLKLCTSLHESGIDCPPSAVLSEESASHLAASEGDRGKLQVIFFGSLQFLPDELDRLKQVCAEGGERRRVVAVGPSFGPEMILQTIRCGAVDYLDISRDFDRELASLVDRIRSSKHDPAEVGRLFTIIGPVGGVGASLLATNLAVALARRGGSCGLLDFQLRGGDLATLLHASPRHTLRSLAEKSQQLDKAMFEQSLVKHESGVHLLAGPEPYSDFQLVSPQVIQKIVHLARRHCPYVVVDLEDCEHPEQVRTLAGSDCIIVPLRLDYVSLWRARKCIEYLTRANVPREHIIPVANRVGQPKELPLDRVEEVLGLAVRHRIADDPSTVNASINLGTPIVIGSPKSKVAAQINRLAESLVATAGGGHNGVCAANGSLGKRPAARWFDAITFRRGRTTALSRESR